jgi:hypothetical protein
MCAFTSMTLCVRERERESKKERAMGLWAYKEEGE